MIPRPLPEAVEPKKTKRQVLQDQLTAEVKAKQPLPETATAVPIQVVENVGPIPQLNEGRTECRIFTHCIVAGSVIYYKPSAAWVVGIGKVERFKCAGLRESDTGSVWMLIQDATDAEKEWCSVQVWAEHKAAGLFDTEIIKEQEPQPEAVRKPQF